MFFGPVEEKLTAMIEDLGNLNGTMLGSIVKQEGIYFSDGRCSPMN